MFERFYKANSDFVYVKLSSDVDDKQLAEHISLYNIEAKERTGLLELCDCRQITSIEKITVQGCVEIGERDTGQNRFLGGKLAFLVSNELQFGLARAFQTFAIESGRKIEIFIRSYEGN